METHKHYQLTLEDGERSTLTDAHIQDGTRLFYTELGPGFGMVAVVNMTLLLDAVLLENAQNAIELFTDLELDYHFANEWDTPKEIETFQKKYQAALAALKALVDTCKTDEI